MAIGLRGRRHFVAKNNSDTSYYGKTGCYLGSGLLVAAKSKSYSFYLPALQIQRTALEGR